MGKTSKVCRSLDRGAVLWSGMSFCAQEGLCSSPHVPPGPKGVSLAPQCLLCREKKVKKLQFGKTLLSPGAWLELSVVV